MTTKSNTTKLDTTIYDTPKFKTQTKVHLKHSSRNGGVALGWDRTTMERALVQVDISVENVRDLDEDIGLKKSFELHALD